MFQRSRWCLVMTPKSALHILGILPSPSTAFGSSFLSSSSSSTGEEDEKDLKVFGSASASTHHFHPSCGTSTYIASHVLAQLTPVKIKKAYITRTLLCHPDLFPDDPRANEKFQHLGEALRVALQVLQSHQHPSGGGGRHYSPGDEDGTAFGASPSHSDALETIQDAMTTFRRCMVAFHAHEKREKRRKHHPLQSVRKPEAKGSTEGGVASSHRPPVVPPPGAANDATMDENDDDDPPFMHSFLEVPSLEHIRDVCQREHTAFLHTQELCATLPALLSGEGTALFDSTAFFFSRCVSLTRACVDRFIRHLPIIVRRVVLQRQRQFRATALRRRRLPLSSGEGLARGGSPSARPPWPASSSSTVENAAGGGRQHVISGLATGNRPQTQKKIEDMAMKPLVLMGVLLFDTVSIVDASQSTPVGKPNAAPEQEVPRRETDEEMQQGSTCPGVYHLRDIHVCHALQCRIHPADTMEIIVQKLADWEQRSFERLQVELAMADVTAFMSEIVMGPPLRSSPSHETSPRVMVVRPNLEASLEEAAGVLEMVQLLTKELCASQEDHLDYLYSEEVVREEVRRQQERRESEPQKQKEAENLVGGRRRWRESDGGTSPSPSSPSASTTTEAASPLFRMGSGMEWEACVRDAEESWWWKRAVACKKLSPLPGTTRPIVETKNVSSSSPCPASGPPSTDTRSLLLPFLIALCRTLSRLATASIRGNIILTWPPLRRHTSPNSTTEAAGKASEGKEKGPVGRAPEGTSQEESEHKKERNGEEEEEKEERRSSTAEAHPKGGSTASPSSPSSSSWCVSRHPTACVAEDTSFAVRVELVPDLFVFLSRWAAAMTKVLELTERSHLALPGLLTLRDQMVKEEFIPCKNAQRESAEKDVEVEVEEEKTVGGDGRRRNGTSRPSPATTTTFASTGDESIRNDVECSTKEKVEEEEKEEVVVDNTEKEKEDEAIEYDYRAPLLMFPRLFNMHTWQEKLFWDRVKEHRVYLARFTRMISPFQVFLDCLPYDPSTSHPILDEKPSSVSPETLSEEDKEGEGYAGRGSSPNIPAGWVGHLEVDGSDQVIITSSLLSSPVDFRVWLEDVVEQSSLQKEVERVLGEENISYVQRDPSLSLTHFLSFLHVFRKAGAVRSVLEAHSSDRGIGWSIVVGTKCDIREGKLYISWHIDPSALISLLQGSHNGGTSVLELNHETDGAKKAIPFLAEV